MKRFTGALEITKENVNTVRNGKTTRIQTEKQKDYPIINNSNENTRKVQKNAHFNPTTLSSDLEQGFF